MNSSHLLDKTHIRHNDVIMSYIENSYTVIIRINAAAFIKFLTLIVRRLFEGGVYFREAFIRVFTV